MALQQRHRISVESYPDCRRRCKSLHEIAAHASDFARCMRSNEVSEPVSSARCNVGGCAAVRPAENNVGQAQIRGIRRIDSTFELLLNECPVVVRNRALDCMM